MSAFTKSRFLAVLLVMAVGIFSLLPGRSSAQARPNLQIFGPNIQKHANGVLTLMSYAVIPDLTSSFLAINNASTDNPNITMWQLGGGFTVSKSTPVYLEGSLGYNRYDPTFVATGGTDVRKIPTKWNTFAATGGIGWDFPITENKEWVIRPIFNFSLGKVSSDLSVAKFFVEDVTGRELDFLDGGSLNAYGLGGSIMLDWEHYRPGYEIDLEFRYTNIHLESFGGTAAPVIGTASAQAANVYARWRAPTGWSALDRPVRYVLESSYTRYLGSTDGVLGFDRLISVGAGLELDTSAHDIFFTRVRAVLRHVFGNNVSGTSLGLAASF